MMQVSKKHDDSFLQIFDLNPIGMIISNLETTKFQYVNEVFLTSFGYTKAEVIGKTSIDLNLIEPESKEKLLFLLQEQGFVKNVEVLVRKKNGEIFWTLISIRIIILNNEKIAVNSFLNITERKKAADDLIISHKELVFQNEEKEKRAAELVIANKELAFQNNEKEKRAAELVIANKELAFQNNEKEKRAAELAIANKNLLKSQESFKNLNLELELKVAERTEQLELINKNILDYKFALDESSIVAVTDQKGVITHVNDNFCKISKYTKGELIGKDHRVINSGYHNREYIRNLWQTISKGKVWRGEMKNKAKDGAAYWVDTTIVPFLNELGKPYKYLAIRSDITERKNALNEIKEQEEKYRSIFNNSLAAISTLDVTSNKILDINETGVSLFGYKSKKDYLKYFDPSFHFVNKTDMDEISQTLFKRGIIKDKVLELIRLDGSRFWVISSGVLNIETKIVQSVMIDITERRKKINELKASEEKYKDLFQNSMVAMFTIDLTTVKVVDANSFCVQLFGYETIEDFYNLFDTKIHFVDQKERKIFREIAIKKGEIFRSIKMKKLNGTIIWTSLFAKINKEKNLVQVMAIDISSQIKITEELKLNESKFKDLFENSLMPIFITDTETKKTIYINKIGSKLLGYNSIEDYHENHNIGRHFVYPSDQEKIKQDIINHGESKIKKLQLKKVDGTPFVVQAVIKLSSDKLCIHSTFIDITKQIIGERELELKVKKRTLKLTESLIREKKLHDLATNFVTLASHEFRTPLATILSSASIIEMYPESHQQSQRVKHVKLIGSTIQNLTGILTDFLLIGELDNGSVKTKITEINLKKFITTIMTETNSILKKKNQEFKYIHVGETKIIQSEKILRNILYNLISNASKYSPTAKNIYLTSNISNGQVIITVEDHGIGIPKADQEKLFSKFYRATNADNVQGTGLGLNIVKRYVELISGKLSFTSTVDEGSTFTIEFSQGGK
jgi:PAS domain S-box-containing protein